MQNDQRSVKLNNGVAMPVLGYGVYQIPLDQTAECVCTAVEAGYRSIDTAMIYQNEQGVGQGIKDCGIDREELFITTKVWNKDHGYEATLKAFNNSLKVLSLDYLDLYLIHWPVPKCGLYIDTWRALEKLYHDGLIRAIGVSNFTIAHLEEIKNNCEIIPTVNQIELHPWLVQPKLREYMEANGIAAEAWSPLAQGALLHEERLIDIAQKYNKTAAQVILRWNVQRNVITIPKSTKKQRMISNIDIFDFELSDQDMRDIISLNKNYRTGPDPDTFNMDANC